MSAAHGALILFVGAFFRGVGIAACSGNNHAMLYDTGRTLRRSGKIAHILGKNASMEQAGLAFSGLAAAVLLWWGVSFQTLMFLTLIPYAINIIVSLMLVEPPRHEKHEGHVWSHMREAFDLLARQPKMAILALCSSWKYGLGLSTYFFAPKFIETVWPTWAIALYRFGQNGVGAVIFWISGKMIKKLGAFRILVGGSFLSEMIAITAYALSSVFSPFMLFLTQIAWALGNTANNTLQQQNFSHKQRSTMGSMISLMGSVVSAVSGVVLGFIADHFGVMTALIVTSVATLPVVVGYLALYKKSAAA